MTSWANETSNWQWVRYLVAAVLFFLTNSAAASPPIDVSWLGPGDCVRGGAVQRKARRALVDSEESEGGSFRVQLIPASTGYTVEFSATVGRDESSRSLDVTSCEEAEDAVVLLVVLAIDPAGASNLASPSSEKSALVDKSASTLDSPGEKEGERLTPKQPASRESDEGGGVRHSELGSGPALGLFVGSGLALQSSIVAPPMAPSMLVSAGARLNGWRVSVSGMWFWANENQVGPADDLSVSLSALGGQLSLGHLWPIGRLRLGPELAAQFQSVRGRREDEPDQTSDSVSYASVGGGVAMEAVLKRWLRLAAKGQILLPTSRPAFVVQPLGEVFRPAPTSFRASLEVVFSIPIKNTRSSGHL